VVKDNQCLQKNHSGQQTFEHSKIHEKFDGILLPLILTRGLAKVLNLKKRKRYEYLHLHKL